MKTLVGTAVVVAGMTLGVPYANAHVVSVVGCTCTFLNRTNAKPNPVIASIVGTLPGYIEQLHIVAGENGVPHKNVEAHCFTDLGPGPHESFSGPANGTCLVDTLGETTDWSEEISASGQTHIVCFYPPRPGH
jgi:hypothetical protein